MSKKGYDRGYVRVSTQKDSQKDSPEHQEAFIREVSARMGMTIDKCYEDRSSATSIIEREDVLEMLEDAKRGEIRSLFFASLTRFSRDALDAITLKRILVNALKVRVVSIEDGYDSGIKDDELLFGIKSVVSQNTSGDISVASRRGIRQSALAGNYIGSIPPYGYRKIVIDDPKAKNGERKTLEIIPEQAAIVKLIFNLYVNRGMGEKSICNYLNGDNDENLSIPSSKGGLWGVTSIQRILQNEHYTGYNIVGKHKVETEYNDITNLLDRRKKLVASPSDEWEKTSFQTHEAIISKEMFDRARDIRLVRGGGKRGGRRKFFNVFAKMIFCAECGSAMVAMNIKVRNKPYSYLVCSRRRRMGENGCSNQKWVPYLEVRDNIIKEVLLAVDERLQTFDKQGAEETNPKLRKALVKNKSKIEKNLTVARKLLLELRKQKMLEEITESQFEFERAEYENEISLLENQLNVIEAEERLNLNLDKTIKEMELASKQLAELKSYDDVEKTRSLLLRTVEKITVKTNGEIDVNILV